MALGSCSWVSRCPCDLDGSRLMKKILAGSLLFLTGCALREVDTETGLTGFQLAANSVGNSLSSVAAFVPEPWGSIIALGSTAIVAGFGGKAVYTRMKESPKGKLLGT